MERFAGGRWAMPRFACDGGEARMPEGKFSGDRDGKAGVDERLGAPVILLARWRRRGDGIRRVGVAESLCVDRGRRSSRDPLATRGFSRCDGGSAVDAKTPACYGRGVGLRYRTLKQTTNGTVVVLEGL